MLLYKYITIKKSSTNLFISHKVEASPRILQISILLKVNYQLFWTRICIAFLSRCNRSRTLWNEPFQSVDFHQFNACTSFLIYTKFYLKISPLHFEFFLINLYHLTFAYIKGKKCHKLCLLHNSIYILMQFKNKINHYNLSNSSWLDFKYFFFNTEFSYLSAVQILWSNSNLTNKPTFV